MAASASLRLQTTSWRRPGEWFLVAVLLLVLLFVFVRYARQVQSLSELAAIRIIVGALRTAMVLDHLQRQLPAAPSAGSLAHAVRNPFELVKQKPLGYAGDLSRVQAASVAPGSWFYVDDCACVGYQPVDDAALDSPSGEPMIWFKLTETAGILQLIPLERYRWADEWLD